MKDNLFVLNKLRFEIFFNSLDQLRLLLSFYQNQNLLKINIPCKNNLKKDFLLSAIKVSREEFPNINIIPHFSIQHQFRRNSQNTLIDLYGFLREIEYLGCNDVLLVSGSQKKATLDSLSTLTHISENSFLIKSPKIGIALNLYLPEILFQEEMLRFKYKLKTNCVSSIWLQFGSDCKVLDKRIRLIKSVILDNIKHNQNKTKISLFGSILIPSKQFLTRFKFRPWKGVYLSREFLNSLEIADYLVLKVLKVYKKHKITPLIETNTSTEKELKHIMAVMKLV
tara:strand:- start:6230 stop:7075 length:846 start_codon:yes stop_codon:yes gene_type:complete